MNLAHALSAALELHKQSKLDRAALAYAAILETSPRHFDALHLLGVVRSQQGRHAEALEKLEAALELNPMSAEAWSNLGLVYAILGRPRQALASFERAFAIRPEDPEMLHNRGIVLRDLNRPEEALASYDRALAIRPEHAPTHFNRGNVLRDLMQPHEALASYDRALAIKPDDAKALYNRGNVLRDLKRPEEALASYDRALAISPEYADAFNNRGSVLQDLNRLEEALTSFGKALAIKADHPYAFGGIADCAIKSCDWTRVESVSRELATRISGQHSIVMPFVLLGYSDDVALQLTCARNYIRSKISSRHESFHHRKIGHRDKIRIAYISADFRRHPTASLTVELFELHDRSRFEVMGISLGADDTSDFRTRLLKSFDQFHDVRAKSDRDVARLLQEHEVDIAVDLMGYTRDARPEILAHRPAPIQVNYLGYPGTMGAEFMDYVIADRIILPFDQQPLFTEKIVHLPDCYLVNDSRKVIAAATPTRYQAGLPESGLVFCCFNNNWKITRPYFDVWMRLLQAVGGSVLWLMRPNSSAETNLRNAAIARGIDPSRMVFADRLPLDEHLARYRLADLFLDTLPYNAHTTASDALWAGLPVLTCCGNSFAGRVAASLLTAIGLPELIVQNLVEYEGLILKLATDAPFRQSIRHKLERNRLVYPLFDTRRFCHHIESAYMTMRKIAQRGERPQNFAVEGISAG